MTCGAFIMTSLDGSLADPNLFMRQTVDSEVRPIWILPKLKPSVRRYLAAKGITEESLFPSGIEGFRRLARRTCLFVYNPSNFVLASGRDVLLGVADCAVPFR